MTGSACSEVVIVRTNGMRLISTISVGLWLCSGCASQTPYNPYPQQYPQYPPQYQAYPYGAQAGQQIQPSAMVGTPAAGTQPVYPIQTGGYQGQPQVYPMQPGQMQPGQMQPTYPVNYGPPPNNPLIGR